MKLLKVEEVKVNKVIELLNKGGVIIYPTETLYGIGVKYDNRYMLRQVFEIKKRPKEKSFPLIVNLNHLSLVVSYIPPLAERLIEKYWPGPLTLILPAKEGLPEEIVKNNTVALRMPGESFALRLIEESSFPITATSANISGKPAASDIETAIGYFNKEHIDLFIDGGKLFGIPSTIIDVTVYPPCIIREGAIKIDLSSY